MRAKKIGAGIYRVRRSLGISHPELGKRVGMGLNRIWRLEHGVSDFRPGEVDPGRVDADRA